MSRRLPQLVLAVSALILIVASASCRKKECTIADQCPNVGDECGWLTSDRTPICPQKMEESHLIKVCERENLLGAGRIGVFCPAAR